MSYISSDYDDSDIYIDWTNKVIKSKYIFIQQIGNGSYAAIWLAYAINQKNLVAIKIHGKNGFESANTEEKIYNYAKKNKIAGVSNCIECFKLKIDDEDFHFVIMELYACSLYEYMKSNYSTGFDEKYILSVIQQILKTLIILHKHNIIHADIKPENILIRGIKKNHAKIQSDLQKISMLKNIKRYISELETNESESDVRKPLEFDKIYDEFVLADLGTCIYKSDNDNSYSNTCYYKSPEYILNLECNKNVDIWALGCSIYELFIGKLLFDPYLVKSMHNRYHLYEIISCLGTIPDKMIKNSKISDIYFRKNMTLKGYKQILLSPKWNNIKFTNSKILDIIFKCLEIDPEVRINAEELLIWCKNNI